MCSFCLAALKRRPPQPVPLEPPNNHQETFCAEAGDEQRKTHKQTHLLRTLSTHHGFLSLRFGCGFVSGLGGLGACQAYPLSKQWEHEAGGGGSNRNVTNKPIKQVLSMKTVRFVKKIQPATSPTAKS